MLIPFDTLGVRPKGVLHVGASTGQEASAYQSLGVEKVVWIEAIPSVYRQLLKHVSNFHGHTAIHACVSNVTGEKVPFHIANNEGQSSSLLELKEHRKSHPEVVFTDTIELETTRIDDIDFDFTGLEFLNIDLQGAELLALEGMGSLLDQFQYAYLEVNYREMYEGCPLIHDLQMFMKSKGFKMVQHVECGNFGWGDAFFKRR